MDSGVATKPIDDFDAYRQRLQQFVYHSGTLMKPVFVTARTVASEWRRIILCEGEDERVLRAAQITVDAKLAKPILIGQPKAIEQSIRNQGLRLRAGEHYTVVDPEDYDRHDEYWTDYQKMAARRGVTSQYAPWKCVAAERWSARCCCARARATGFSVARAAPRHAICIILKG